MKKILVIGSLNIDFVINVENMPLPGETISAKDFNLICGGKGANQAYAAAKLGGNVSMIGAVGNDQYGKMLIDNLESVGVDTSGIKVMDNVDTGRAFITVDGSGENSIVVVSGANGLVSKELIDEKMDLIDSADIIVMQLEIPLYVVSYVAELARMKDKIVILDPAPATNIPSDILRNIDIIKPNETELETLCGFEVNSDEDVIKGAISLIDNGVEKVIVTLGEKGSMYVDYNSDYKYDAFDVDVVDTTGAGDAFTGALVKSLVDGREVSDAIKYAHFVSSIVVGRKGAQTSIPSEEEVYEFINKGGNYEKNNN